MTRDGLRGALLACIVAIQPSAGAEEIVTIAVRHRLAEDLAPLIRPLLESGETVVPSGGLLIVKARAERLDDIHSLVEQLDRRAHRLMVTVAQGRGLTRESLGAGVSGTVGAAPRLHGHLYQTEAQAMGQRTQRVQTLDGQAAMIQVGEQVPLPTQNIVGYGPAGTVVLGQSSQYVDASSGFAVTPRLGSGQVTLDIAPWSNRVGRRGNGAIDSQSARTTVRTELGQWVELGGQVDTNSQDQGSLGGHAYSTQTQANRIFLRVDDLDASNP